MAQSLSTDCTPLKTKYDSCFNAWLESYLSPDFTSAISRGASHDEWKAQRIREKSKEYEDKCGEVWRAYNACVTKAVKEHKLEELIRQAREENPLRDLENHLDRTSSAST